MPSPTATTDFPSLLGSDRFTAPIMSRYPCRFGNALLSQRLKADFLIVSGPVAPLSTSGVAGKTVPA